MNILIIFIFIAPLTWRLLTNYQQGVSWAVFLLTALSANPVILSGGTMPNFSLHRLILILLLIVAMKNQALLKGNHAAPLKWILVLYAFVNLLPMIFTIDLLMSIKSYLSFTVEIVLFYFIICASIQTKEDAKRIVLACTAALVAVGVMALIERFAHFNPVDAYMPGYVRKPEYVNDILSTFPHRILFGAAMAMGLPLALAFAQAEMARRWAWWIGVCILLLSCYFSFSRGPWLAAVLAGMAMFVLAGWRVRRQALIIVVLLSIVLAMRPGVWKTLSSSVHDTADVDSFKGQTYQYRWELWGIAWKKISQSGTRILFGFGQGSTEVMTFETELSYTSDTTTLWSWDNHYAATLFETGLVGLASFVGLYGFFFLKLFRGSLRAAKEDKAIQVGITVAMAAMLFIMTNVAIFAPQLNYLLWALIAAGLRLGADDLREDAYAITTGF